jgi:mannose-6-phosphate isomerase-like protein (cupin superfamily)
MRIGISVGAVWAVSLVLSAQTNPNNAAPKTPELMPRDREITLALAAAPPHLRDAATVYVLERNGYVVARKGTNGFTCLVHRDHPMNQKPTCWDREGSETIVPAVLKEGELLMQGKSVPEVRAEIKKGFDAGTFIAPRRPGVAYMLSNGNKNYNARTGGVDIFPPHVMFYAPNLTDADIGSKGDGAGGLPFTAYNGPHGYMITMVPQPASEANMTQDSGTKAKAQAFGIEELRAQREKAGRPYLPFLNVPSMRMGLYSLAVGAEDKQTPHDEDEVYYVMKGRATLRVEAEEYPVQVGSMVFVAAHAAHKFHDIAEGLEVVVFFAAGPGVHH